ncbi:PucR family transcriptional regulator [Nocardia mangyaensis]|uniref:PucR family transcriptional regulator n=1 Tax=Nocardia mangyaensis TaxID=2213200 RepID=UPI002674F8B7|nr:helix-turn-helix domain-containing protein [Nocardia mangyaensis]MDO3648240.1 helix-turn-helix domain-containing protein [Nocardia mangyaensis]
MSNSEVSRRRLSEMLSVPTPDRVSGLVAEIGAGLRARASEVADGMARWLIREVAHSPNDPLLEELRIASVHANVATMIDILADGTPVGRMQPPRTAVEYARRAAQREIPPNLLVRSYRMGENAMMRICHDEVGRRDLPVALGLAVINRITEMVYSYADWITLYVFETYEAERERWLGIFGNVHQSTVHGLLSATNPDAAGFEAATDYRLDRVHLAVILWYTGNKEVDILNVAESRVASMGRQLEFDGPPLVTAIDSRTLWVWFPFAGLPAADPGALRSAADLPEGVRWATGSAGHGLDGFRRSHRQAAAAHLVAALPGTPSDRSAIGFGDPGVAVVSLLAEDMDATRTWVREVLGELADDTEPAAALRETLSTYYETGQSHVHTAQRMALHRNTVKHRVTKALRSIRMHGGAHEKLDIAVALQVCRVLGGNVLRTPD